MKIISIIEIDYHPEVLRNLCLYLQGSNFSIKIFTTKKIWSQVGVFKKLPENFELFLINQTDSVESFFDKYKKVWNTSDLIFFNTIASHFRYFCIQKYAPTVLVRIHNINAYFGSLYSYRPKFSLFYLWKDFSFFIRKILVKWEWYYKMKFMGKANFFMFPNEIITEEAMKRVDIDRKKIIETPIPFVHSEEINRPKVTEPKIAITIGIIGSIDRRRRNYLLVYQAFEKLCRQLEKKVTLVLLGSSNTAYGRSIIKKFKSLENENFNLKYFSKFIDEEVFSATINAIDFLILPLIIDTRYTIFLEKYGTTKVSGNINDLIKYHKPAIIPQQYQTDTKLDELVEKYKNQEELLNILEKWINSGYYLNKCSQKIMLEYNFKEAQRKTISIFQDIISMKHQ